MLADPRASYVVMCQGARVSFNVAGEEGEACRHVSPLNQKKSGCSGASVAGWALAQGGTLAASPEEDWDVGGLSYTEAMSPATTWRLLPGRVGT